MCEQGQNQTRRHFLYEIVVVHNGKDTDFGLGRQPAYKETDYLHCLALKLPSIQEW